ncbi:MAG: aromatic amino acid lyase, partial [Devosia sp.]
MQHVATPLTLDGKPLTFGALARIGQRAVTLSADLEAMARVDAARRIVDERIARGEPVYGATTGVGAMKDVEWSPADLEAFNLGLVRAHHFGTGAPFPNSVVRNAMAIRVNTALTGRVGCSRGLVDAYLGLLANDVVPVVRRTGSIGTADIGLMGQIGAVLTGVGEAVYQNRRMSAEAALA